ncbi:MAG: hypothetical protein HRT57_04895 [Crocinitomicaceae bacterium]|nr:hypothetical protein [Crocinitomicaceae bacterium]
MKWIGKRVSFVDDKSKTTIVVHPKDIGWLKGLMGAWVSMWLTLGAIVIWYSLNSKFTEQESIIIIIFLAFWVYFAFKVMKSWFWLMWGKELIKIDEAKLIYKKSIRKYGKSKFFLLENISKIAVYKTEERSLQAAWEKSPWVIGGERLEFEYQGKVIKIGRKLDAKDAELLFKLLTKRIETQVRKNKKRQD